MIVLLSCSSSNKYELFEIRTFSNYRIIDFNELNNIEAFNEAFWKADSINNKFSFVAKFNFEKGVFSNSSEYGIKLEGLPYQCLIHDCSNKSSLQFYYSGNYDIMDEDLNVLTEDEVKNLVIQNILNYGKNPTLSESPKAAVTELFLNLDQNISELAPSLKLIADCYIDLIEAKKKETGLTTKLLLSEFPLLVQLRRKMYSRDLNPTVQSVAIYEEIEIDFQE